MPDKSIIEYEASVDQSFLSKVDRVFDASPVTIWNELLQNARRAGASKVTVQLAWGTDAKSVAVHFCDNGPGMDDPIPLLRLARSEWGAEVEHEEDPAGMGFFCLSTFASGVSVRSKSWGTHITPDVFKREAKATRVEYTDHVQGLILKWTWDAQSNDSINILILETALRRAAEFCGLQSVEIIADSKRSEITPGDFLKGCYLVREIPELGIRIGAIPDTSSYALNGGNITVELNFRGLQLTPPGCKFLEALCYIGAKIKVDVLHTRKIQLVLPSRNAVKHNAGLVELHRACEQVAYEWISKCPAEGQRRGHNLSFSVYKRALDEFGLDIGEAENDLRAFGRSYLCGSADSGAMEVVVKSTDITTSRPLEVLMSSYNIARHRSAGADKPSGLVRAFRGNTRYAGYRWYDALPELIDVVVRIDGKVIPLPDFLDYQGLKRAPSTDLHTVVNEMEVEFRISDGSIKSFNPSILVAGDVRYSVWENVDCDVHIYLLKSALAEVTKLSLLEDQLSEYLFESDEYEESERQASAFGSDVMVWLLEMCGRRKEAVEHELLSELARISDTALGNNLVRTVSHDGRAKDRCHSTPMIDSLQFSEDEEMHHKLLLISTADNEWQELLTSDEAITTSSAADYLRARYGLTGANCGFRLYPVPQAVRLRDWPAPEAVTACDAGTE